MSVPSVRQIRAWERRAKTLERNARALTCDMMDVVGVEFEMAGENFTSQADDTAESAANLESYLAFCATLAKRKERATPSNTPDKG